MIKVSNVPDYPNADIEYPESSTIEILFSEQEPTEKGYYRLRWECDHSLSSYYWYWNGYNWFYDSRLLTKVTDSIYSWIGLKYNPNS